jgi:hypothetical protein
VALVTEDGTGKLDADSPNSVAELNAYHANNDAWTVDDLATEEAAREASLAMEERWGPRARSGRPKVLGQALSYPRVGAYRRDGETPIPPGVVPPQWKAAHAILTAAARAAPLLPDLPRGSALSSWSMGPQGPDKTSVSQTFAPGAPSVTIYQRVEAILAPILRPVGEMRRGYA